MPQLPLTTRTVDEELAQAKQRIAELEKENELLKEANQEAKEFINSYIKAPKPAVYGSGKIYNAEKQFEAIKLEQQAKGLIDFVSERMEHYWILHLNDKIAYHLPLIEANMKAEQLRQKAKKLKQ